MEVDKISIRGDEASGCNLCDLVDGCQYFGKTCTLHSQDHFYLQDGDSSFPRNVGGLLPDYMIS